MSNETRIQHSRGGHVAPDLRSAEFHRTPEPRGPEHDLDLAAFTLTLRKHYRAILITFLIVFSAIGSYTLFAKRIYSAQALVEIERENPNILTAQDLFTIDSVSDVYLETQYKILKSDALAERVIEELGLNRSAVPTPSRPPRMSKGGRASATAPQKAQTEAALHQRTLAFYQKRLDVSPIRRSRLVAISFESENPELAARFVNTLASDYLEQNLREQREASQRASEWLTQQLVVVEAKLRKSESELHRYAGQNDLGFLEISGAATDNLVYEHIRQLQEELSKAQAERYEKESVYNLLRTSDYASLPGVFEDKLIQDLSLQLTGLQQQAAQVRATFNSNYPKAKQIQNQIVEVEAALSHERQHAAEKIEKEYAAAVNRETFVRHDLDAQQKHANFIAEKLTRYNDLKREVDTNRNIYEVLLQRLKQASVSTELKTSAIRIVDWAKLPYSPSKPKVVLNLGLGAGLGLLFGICIALLKQHNDKTVQGPEEVERLLSLPLLAFVPTVRSSTKLRPSLGSATRLSIGLTKGDRPRIASPAISEAFRSLRTSVLFSITGPPPKSILVASAQPSDGKTTVATNFAIALAELGHRVLLIDADMRRPRLHQLFGVPTHSGLADYLAGDDQWRKMVQPAQDGLDVLLCGAIPPNPVELLSSLRLRKLLDEAIEEYNYLVFDSPPLLNVADGRIIAKLVEGIVLVVSCGGTPRLSLQRADSYVRGVGGNIVGIVLNKFDLGDYYYSKKSRYDYYAPTA